MKAGISTACLFAQKETEQALTALKELGAELIDLNLNTFYEYRPEFAGKFAQNAEGTELCSVRVNPNNFEAQLFSPSRRVRGDGFYWLDQVIRSCNKFGIKKYTFRGVKGNGREDIGNSASAINAVTEFCSRYGVRLCIQNSAFGLYNRAGIFKELKSCQPDICGALDLRQAVLSKGSAKAYIDDMSGAISHIYLSEFGAEGKPLTESDFDFKELIKMLKGAGFDGAVIMDISDWNGDIPRLKRFYERLKELFG